MRFVRHIKTSHKYRCQDVTVPLLRPIQTGDHPCTYDSGRGRIKHFPSHSKNGDKPTTHPLVFPEYISIGFLGFLLVAGPNGSGLGTRIGGPTASDEVNHKAPSPMMLRHHLVSPSPYYITNCLRQFEV